MSHICLLSISRGSPCPSRTNTLSPPLPGSLPLLPVLYLLSLSLIPALCPSGTNLLCAESLVLVYPVPFQPFQCLAPQKVRREDAFKVLRSRELSVVWEWGLEETIAL